MNLQCPYCHGYGVYKVKKRWWERLLRRQQWYQCVDCERHSERVDLNEVF